MSISISSSMASLTSRASVLLRGRYHPLGLDDLEHDLCISLLGLPKDAPLSTPASGGNDARCNSACTALVSSRIFCSQRLQILDGLVISRLRENMWLGILLKQLRIVHLNNYHNNYGYSSSDQNPSYHTPFITV